MSGARILGTSRVAPGSKPMVNHSNITAGGSPRARPSGWMNGLTVGGGMQLGPTN